MSLPGGTTELGRTTAPRSMREPYIMTEFSPIMQSSSIIQLWMLHLASMVTFLPMLTDEARPAGSEWAVLIVVESPIEENYPILTGLCSALIVTLYHTVAHLLTKTSPTSAALGAIHDSVVCGTAS